MTIDLGSRLDALELETRVISALPRETPRGTSQERYSAWHAAVPRALLQTEYLLPRIVRRIELVDAPFMDRRSREGRRLEGTVRLRKLLRELGPWRLPFRIGELVTLKRVDARERILFRRELIGGTLQLLLGDALREASILDIGCNAGFFSLDLADRGAREVHGVDLREENIRQARFLADFYGIDNARFAVSDVDALATGTQFDVVLNLGLLYHVTDPIDVIRKTYDLCRHVAVIDTAAHKEPVSGYFLFRDKDVDKPTEGREAYEMHPTYRGVIDTLASVGFSRIVEVVGHSQPPHELYEQGTRRCFLAFK